MVWINMIYNKHNTQGTRTRCTHQRKSREMTITIKSHSGDQQNRKTTKDEDKRKKKIQAKHKEVLAVTNTCPSRDRSKTINKKRTTFASTKIK